VGAPSRAQFRSASTAPAEQDPGPRREDCLSLKIPHKFLCGGSGCDL